MYFKLRFFFTCPRNFAFSEVAAIENQGVKFFNVGFQKILCILRSYARTYSSTDTEYVYEVRSYLLFTLSSSMHIMHSLAT